MEFVDQPSGGPVNRVERDDDQQRKEEYRLPDMPQYVMPHLVPHHEEQFVFVEFRDDRVPQNYTLSGAEAAAEAVESFRFSPLRNFIAAPASIPAPSADLKILPPSSLLFIGPNLLKSGSIQTGSTRIIRMRKGIASSPVYSHHLRGLFLSSR